MITFIHVSKKYGTRTALHDVSFKVDAGSIVSVIGPSGAGKTTILRCINRMIDCSEGTITVNKQSVTGASRKALKKIRQKVGMIFQSYNLVERLTVIENILHGSLGSMPLYRSIAGLYTAETKSRAYALLDDIGLSEYCYQRCSELSGGQKQRVGIARALMQQPDILLCDEPVSALDPQNAQAILSYIHTIVRRQNLTCILNMHHIEYAKIYSDRILGLKAGQLVFDGIPENLSEAVLSGIFSADPNRSTHAAKYTAKES